MLNLRSRLPAICRYVSAGDVLPVLVQALTEPGTEGAGGAPGGGLPGASPQPQQQQQQRGGAGTNSYLNQNNTTGLGGSSSGSTLNISEELTTQPVNTTPQAVTIGNSKLIADQRANSIIVLANREVVMKVEKILDQMDVQAPQVALSTVIGQLTLTNNEEFGADWFAKYNKRFVGTSAITSVALPYIQCGARWNSSSCFIEHYRSFQSDQFQSDHSERR